MDKTAAAKFLGALGGKQTSPRKTLAARQNARLPRPKRKVKKVVDVSQAVS